MSKQFSKSINNEYTIHDLHNSNKKAKQTLPPLDSEGRGSATMMGNQCTSNSIPLNSSVIMSNRRTSPSSNNTIRWSPSINNKINRQSPNYSCQSSNSGSKRGSPVFYSNNVLQAKLIKECEKIVKKSPNSNNNQSNDRISPSMCQQNCYLTLKIGTEQKWDINNINTNDPNIILPVLRPKAVRMNNTINNSQSKTKDKKIRWINLKEERKLETNINKPVEKINLDKNKRRWTNNKEHKDISITTIVETLPYDDESCEEQEDSIRQTSERIVCEKELKSIFSNRKTSDSPPVINGNKETSKVIDNDPIIRRQSKNPVIEDDQFQMSLSSEASTAESSGIFLSRNNSNINCEKQNNFAQKSFRPSLININLNDTNGIDDLNNNNGTKNINIQSIPPIYKNNEAIKNYDNNKVKQKSILKNNNLPILQKSKNIKEQVEISTNNLCLTHEQLYNGSHNDYESDYEDESEEETYTLENNMDNYNEKK